MAKGVTSEPRYPSDEPLMIVSDLCRFGGGDSHPSLKTCEKLLQGLPSSDYALGTSCVFMNWDGRRVCVCFASVCFASFQSYFDSQSELF